MFGQCEPEDLAEIYQSAAGDTAGALFRFFGGRNKFLIQI
jgi:hypothetical protein